jgi:hypothetical protein
MEFKFIFGKIGKIHKYLASGCSDTTRPKIAVLIYMWSISACIRYTPVHAYLVEYTSPKKYLAEYTSPKECS